MKISIFIVLVLISDFGLCETISVKIKGLQSNEGGILVNLFCEHQDVLKIDKAYRQIKLPISNQMAMATFSDIPAGNYALSIVHDLNGNGKLDHRLGFPAEPVRFSNHFKLGIFSGMPSFEKLKFKLTSMTEIEIDFSN